MNLKKVFNLKNLPYIIVITLSIITTIVLLSFKLYYSALFFFISSLASFFTPLLFISPKEGRDKFNLYLIKMIIRILYLTIFSLGFGLLWIYIDVFKLNVNPAFLLVFPSLSLVEYIIVIIKQIKLSKKND